MGVKILLVVLGSILFILSFFYNKDYHKKHFSQDASSGTVGDSTFIGFIVILLMSICPWYVTRSIIFLLGLGSFIVAFKYV